MTPEARRQQACPLQERAGLDEATRRTREVGEDKRYLSKISYLEKKNN